MMPAPAAKPRQVASPLRKIHVWSPTLWSIRIDKPEGFDFAPGHYVRLGLPASGEDTAWRPYSIVSAPAEAELEFLVTLIPDGALTGRLAKLRLGDPILIETAALGFFLAEALAPGENLWMLATGSGLGPYLSLLRHGQGLAGYRALTLVHCTRQRDELAYAAELTQRAQALDGRLHYLPLTTREPGPTGLQGRIPHLLASGVLETEAATPFDPLKSRVMVCGNPDFAADMRHMLNQQGFLPCRRGMAGSMLFEKYW